MKRYWINVPSTLHGCHKFHGMQVLGPKKLDDDFVTVYPNSGPVVSMRISANCLSLDWAGHDYQDKS